MSTSDEDSYSMIFTSLKHPLRRKILRILSSGAQTFSDLQKQFTVESSHLTYHIDSLGSLLYKTEDGKYALSSLGEGAVSMMRNVEEPSPILHLPFARRSGGIEKKIAGRGVAIALGIICIVLAATLVGAFAYYVPMVNSKNTTISSLNSEVMNLQNQTTSDNTTMVSLQNQIDSLKSQITELENSASSDNAAIANLSSTLATLNDKITKLTDELNQLETWVLNETMTLLNQTQTPMAKGSNGGLQLTMTLKKTLYRLGEPIGIALTITNISNQTVTFGLGPDVNDFDFHVYNDTNSNIHWYSSIWIGSAIPMYIFLITLNSTGDTWSKNFVWQQNMVSSETVSSGTYYIVGRVGPPFFFGGNSTLETTPIQITILPF